MLRASVGARPRRVRALLRAVRLFGVSGLTAAIRYAWGAERLQVDCGGRPVVLDRPSFRALANHGEACVSGYARLCGVELPAEEAGWLAWFCGAVRRAVEAGVIGRDGRYWTVGGWRFAVLLPAAVEVFVLGHWPSIDLRGRDAVDVGAYVGETALWLLAHGARHVTAIEPHPAAYRQLLHTLEINGAAGKVTAVNAAVGPRPGITTVPDAPLHAVIGMDALSAGGGRHQVPVITLDGLSGYLLKLDCEGCERHIPPDVYGQFEVVLVEHHGRPPHMPRHECRPHSYPRTMVCLRRA